MADEKGQHPLFRLTLRALPDAVPWPVRARRALKTLLRSYKLRCVEAVGLPPGDDTTPEEEPTL